MNKPFNRRQFISTLGLAAASTMAPTLGASANKNSKLRILQIGVGGVGGMDRGALRKHPKVEIAGLCDVNQITLGKIAKQFPKAKTYKDCRDAFSDDMNQYDAVLVCTPDHTHAVMALEALSQDKHLYLQKPVVHQLDELRMLKKAVVTKPHLATQMGNQRSSGTGRKQAIEIVRSGAARRSAHGHGQDLSPKILILFHHGWKNTQRHNLSQRMSIGMPGKTVTSEIFRIILSSLIANGERSGNLVMVS